MSQKIENVLNLALEASNSEREASGQLETGFIPETKEWELILKYSGQPEQIRETAESFTELLAGYAVAVVREERIEELAALPEVEFIEKPKSLYFQTDTGRRVSCIDPVQQLPEPLSGKGVLIGIVDSGIDFQNPDFRNEDGTTRIAALWDQSAQGVPPNGYDRGREYTREEINEALFAEDPEERRRLLPTVDFTGHGTAVAGIAAGNGRGSDGKKYRGAAPEAELVIVKMGTPRQEGFPRTTELMLGIDYVIRKGIELRMPAAVNVSFGNTYGSHDGTSLVERFLNEAANIWKTVICVGSGNEGAAAGHAAGRLTDEETEQIELAVQERQPSMDVQIWKSYADDIAVELISPSGAGTGILRESPGAQRFRLGGTELLVYYGEPKPYSVRQEIYISFLPSGDYVESGVWRIVLNPRRIVDGIYEMWLPSQAALNVGTQFLRPDSFNTLTIPSVAYLVTTVAAYDARTFTYADFSGRGSDIFYEGKINGKPDLAAPGVDITAPVPGGGYRAFTGTSFAVPFVTGAAALLMQWGIINGNDPYLYGEKVKAYLRRGAVQLPGYGQWPNPLLGYGILCVKDSIPE